MKLYSTQNPSSYFSLKEAVIKGLPDDNGLFMPTVLPSLSGDFISNLSKYSFSEIALTVAKNLIQDSIPISALESIIFNAINFPAPIVQLDDNHHILELFHGPSLAFKDFGARFMAQTMSFFNKDEDKELVILVATSGDTGGAVASGFYDTPGIKVVILYPSGKVSDLQEKQLTTLGKNITALEINGTFDDCQALVKQAFLNKDLTQSIRLSSANSINIARLIPQSFYYFEAYKQVDTSRDVVFAVPSGNFGNITAGLFAKKMGLPIHHFIAATNVNDVVPHYLKMGSYEQKPSIATISNAMDVGNPSNFARMLDLYGSTWNNMKEEISGYSFNDDSTRLGIKEVFDRYAYIIDPHGAVGYLAFKAYLEENPGKLGVILETAHPSKFLDVVEPVLNTTIDVPERLAVLADKEKQATYLEKDFSSFKDWLLDNY
ncbi:MAG: threonine synthase [Saprospiraceae bacterium]|jgi:threonine synthase